MGGQVIPEASLLGLPRELRDLIYQYALLDYDEAIGGDGLLVQKRQHIPSHCLQSSQPWPQQPLTRVNRQLRGETLGLCYELGMFSVTVNSMVLYPLMRWAELIGVENCKRLKRVEVVWIADRSRGAYMRNGVSEFMAAERFRKSELGQALEPALNYEKFFKVSASSLRSYLLAVLLVSAVTVWRREAYNREDTCRREAIKGTIGFKLYSTIAGSDD